MASDSYYGSGPGFDPGDLVDLYDIGRDLYNAVRGSDGVPSQSTAVVPYQGQTVTARPVNGNAAAAGMPNALVPLEAKQIASCPKGYVAVDTNGDGIPDACAHKSVARCYGWKPAKKPPISAGAWSAFRKAHSTVKKMDRIVDMRNEVVGQAKLVKGKRGGRR